MKKFTFCAVIEIPKEFSNNFSLECLELNIKKCSLTLFDIKNSSHTDFFLQILKVKLILKF